MSQSKRLKVTVRLARVSHKPNVLGSPVGVAMTALAVMNATPGGQPIPQRRVAAQGVSA